VSEQVLQSSTLSCSCTSANPHLGAPPSHRQVRLTSPRSAPGSSIASDGSAASGGARPAAAGTAAAAAGAVEQTPFAADCGPSTIDRHGADADRQPAGWAGGTGALYATVIARLLLEAEAVEMWGVKWRPVVVRLAAEAARSLSPSAISARSVLDPALLMRQGRWTPLPRPRRPGALTRASAGTVQRTLNSMSFLALRNRTVGAAPQMELGYGDVFRYYQVISDATIASWKVSVQCLLVGIRS
jgi:hypothetical protein